MHNSDCASKSATYPTIFYLELRLLKFELASGYW